MTVLFDPIDALTRDPGATTSVEAAKAAALELGEWGRYAEACAARARRFLPADLAQAVPLLIEAAEVSEERLQDVEGAAALYREVTGFEPGNRRALIALASLCDRMGDDEALLEVYRARLKVAADDGERTTLHQYVAEVLSERMGQVDAAFDEIQKATRLAPQNLRIIGRLERLGTEAGREAEVAVVLGDLILHQDNPKVRAGLSLRLAELNRGPLQDPERALACYRAAVLDDGANPGVLKELHDVFAEQARFGQLADLLEEVSRDRRVGPHRLRVQRELAALYERELGDPARALAVLSSVLLESPDDRDLVDQVLRLGVVAGAAAEAAEIFERLLERCTNTLLRTYVRLKLGDIYARLLELPKEAIRVYEALLGDDPELPEAHRRLEALYATVGEGDKLDALRARPPSSERLARAGHTLPPDLLQSSDLVPLDLAMDVGRPDVSAPEPDAEPTKRMVTGEGPSGRLAVPSHAPPLDEVFEVPTAPIADDLLLGGREEETLDGDDSVEFLLEDLDPRALLMSAREAYADAPDTVQVRLQLARALDLVSEESSETEGGSLRAEAERHWFAIVSERPGALEALERLESLRRVRGAAVAQRWATELLLCLAPEARWQALGTRHQDRVSEAIEAATVPSPVRLEVPTDPAEFSDFGAVLEGMGYAPLVALGDQLPTNGRSFSAAIGASDSRPHRAVRDASQCLRVEEPPLFVDPHCELPIDVAWVNDGPALVVSSGRAASEPMSVLRFYAGRALSLLRPRALGVYCLPPAPLRAALEGFAGDSVLPQLKFSEPALAKRYGAALRKGLMVEDGQLLAALMRWLSAAHRTSIVHERLAVIRTAERCGALAAGSLCAAVRALEQDFGRDRRWFVPLVEFAVSGFYTGAVGATSP